MADITTYSFFKEFCLPYLLYTCNTLWYSHGFGFFVVVVVAVGFFFFLSLSRETHGVRSYPKFREFHMMKKLMDPPIHPHIPRCIRRECERNDIFCWHNTRNLAIYMSSFCSVYFLIFKKKLYRFCFVIVFYFYWGWGAVEPGGSDSVAARGRYWRGRHLYLDSGCLLLSKI